MQVSGFIASKCPEESERINRQASELHKYWSLMPLPPDLIAMLPLRLSGIAALINKAICQWRSCKVRAYGTCFPCNWQRNDFCWEQPLECSEHTDCSQKCIPAKRCDMVVPPHVFPWSQGVQLLSSRLWAVHQGPGWFSSRLQRGSCDWDALLVP